MAATRRTRHRRAADEAALQKRYREALAWHQAGRLETAEAGYRAILERMPTSFHALHMLGVLHGQRNDWAEAERLIARAVEINPDVAAAHANLGNARRLLGRREEALASYERALELQPDQARALKGRGLLLWEGKRPEEALAVYNALLLVEPEYADGWFVRGACLDRLGLHEAALASYRTGLGLPHASDSEKLRFLLAAKGSGEAPPVAPPDYVRSLFDIYAHIFEQHLVGDLGYHVPEQLVEALRPHLPPAPFDVLDVGCGTGLSGALLRPFARRLTGVDLSPAMLEQAGLKNVYDELANGDLTGWMAAHPGAYDLIVATDVFIYIGDLAPVLVAARAALRPGGLLGFSTERVDDAGVKLQTNLRYAHAPGYVQQLAADGGWRIEWHRDAALRREKGADVAGQIVVMRRVP